MSWQKLLDQQRFVFSTSIRDPRSRRWRNPCKCANPSQHQIAYINLLFYFTVLQTLSYICRLHCLLFYQMTCVQIFRGRLRIFLFPLPPSRIISFMSHVFQFCKAQNIKLHFEKFTLSATSNRSTVFSEQSLHFMAHSTVMQIHGTHSTQCVEQMSR